jgi:DNA-directed RNA polymerase specialized sigma24 family protein
VKLQMAPTVHPSARKARRVRDIAGLTVADIAKVASAAPSTARAWLAGARSPGRKMSGRTPTIATRYSKG